MFDGVQAFQKLDLTPKGLHIPKVDAPWSTSIATLKITIFEI